MPIIPIAIMLALGAGVWALTRKPSETTAAAPNAAKPEPAKQLAKGPATSNQAQTGPQMLSRDQKVAFFKLLPSLVVVEDASKASFDSGRLQPKTQQIAPSDKSAPALSIVYKASMGGHSVLVAKNGDDTMILVPAAGAENGFAKTGSDWFIVLSPNEADAVAKAAGIDPEKVDESGAPVETSAPKDGASTFRPVIGNPFRKGAQAAVTAASALKSSLSGVLRAAALAVVGPEHTDYKLVEGPLGDAARAAVESGQFALIVNSADDLLKYGYAVAAKQLFDLARGAGWAPYDGDDVHYPLMTLDEVMASPHKRFYFPNRLVSGATVKDAISSASSSVGGGVFGAASDISEAIGQVMRARESAVLAARDRALSNVPALGDVEKLEEALVLTVKNGYQTAAEDLNAALKLLGKGDPSVGKGRALAAVKERVLAA